MNRDHRDQSIIKIGKNTEKSLGDVRKLLITQTFVKDTSAEKTRRIIIITIIGTGRLGNQRKNRD